MAGTREVDGRRERSRRTRARVVGAATDLFVADGYLATTVEAVAARAGVAVQTVYYVFGTKSNLLAAVLDTRIVGDDEPLALLERPWVDTVAHAPDGRSAIGSLVRECVTILERVAPVYEAVRRASADPDVGALLVDNRSRRRSDERRLVEMVAEAGHLRPDVDVDTAADIVYGVLNEEVFLLLTADCGWPTERFRAWATGLLLQQLAGLEA
ncbi:MAG TPA: TetR family transcriptional regulator [Acidimicrobiales bacterium]